LTKCRGCVVEWSETKNKSCSEVLVDPLDWSNRRLRKSGKNSVAVVETASHEGCNELGHHIVVDVPSDLFQTSELVEAAGCDLGNMLLECQLLVNEYSKITHYIRWLDDFTTYLQCQIGWGDLL